MVTPPATSAVSRATVDTFYRAYMSRDPQQIAATIADDIEWYVAGPVDVMQICGVWHGKAAVVDRFANQVPKIVAFRSLDIEHLLVDNDCSAMFGRIHTVHRQSGRLISHRVSHIVRYRDGKVVSFRCINDSLDAAEQFIGRTIDFSSDAPQLADGLIVV